MPNDPTSFGDLPESERPTIPPRDDRRTEPPRTSSPASSDTTMPSARSPGAHGEQPGDVIDRFTLLRPLGEGGFGTVWLAERREPMLQSVALKIIKPGMDSSAVVARFEQERQALAVMDHPNVARVIDGGVTERGRPYFVMEYVNGQPITDFADRKRLTLRQRLELFTTVCDAVQHAHMKGIIHRDIKPSNVLVAQIDGTPVVKVIDFGVAKAITHQDWANTAYTQEGMVIGTPEYMSPEQIAGELDIDTRSDVYSLGVMLYELLTGELPFDTRELRRAGLAEIQRIIREVAPPKPSTRLMQLAGDRTTTIVHDRSATRDRLSAELRRELDWIPLMALRKERDRRYSSAAALAEDVRRYLAGQALLAAPDSRTYLARKFVKRNRVEVIAGGVVVAALAAGLVVSLWQRNEAVRAQRAEADQRAQAEVARAEALDQKAQAQQQEAKAKEQEAEATKQQGIAEAVAKFQTDMLATADPDKLLGDKVTVLQAMQAAVKELDGGSLKDQPLVEASVRNTIGRTLHGLARYDEADHNLRKSLEIRRNVLPAGHPDIAVSLNNLAMPLMHQNKLAEAEPLFREALEIYRTARPAGHPDIALSLSSLASLLQDQNKLTEAEPLFREALEIYRSTLQAGHPYIATGLNNLANLLRDQNNLAEAEPLFLEALEIYRTTFPSGHPKIAASLNNLGGLLLTQNRLAEAEPFFREALQIFRESLPAGHPSIAIGLSNLADTLRSQNKLAEAEPLFREALEIDRKALPAGHPNTAHVLNNLALILQSQSKFAEAEPLCREVIEIYRKALPVGHPNIAIGLNNLADLLQAQNELAEAEPLLREALAIRRTALPAGHPYIANALNSLATLLQAQNKLAEAEPLFREALEIYRSTLQAGHPYIATGLNNLAVLLQAQNKLAEAEPLYSEALSIRRTALPAGHQDITDSLKNLAGILTAQNKFAEAEPLFREALEINRTALPAGHPDIATGLSNLARAQYALGRIAEARAGWDEAIAILRKGSPEGSPLLARVLWRSGSARLENKDGTGDAAAALPELEEAVAMAEKVLPPEHPQLKEYRETLAKCKAALGK
jgi:serine/threonine protein kinase/Tfp pilus assembly protein PilF